MRRNRSIAPDWFEALYREQGDPWNFETSAYERAKYDHTLAALPCPRLGSMLEVGCANGVLTERLAPRCDRLLAVDVSETALAAAAVRCADLPQVVFERRHLPAEAPPGSFDLILLSEVIYYWDSDDLARMADYLRGAVPSGGHLMLVHWLGETDYPKSGDAAVGELAGLLGDAVEVIAAERREEYRLDLWRRR
ncbi:SAM-dependent methyltransferase [Sphingomonas sp. KR1UV-12]|uniref:SAM-dependent methyltransferase n=2 Tax=Sphingomonas aurea TaxID=3063994 RepID=A0ABT9EG12_9SPHN|nr:SAM-dependent methyltransferase [Sphingomonas sp. KR1UV-12]MDP1025907.1 SAM-dependent methyltransferase [Sphingomonas sp. KR1UV-12]